MSFRDCTKYKLFRCFSSLKHFTTFYLYQNINYVRRWCKCSPKYNIYSRSLYHLINRPNNMYMLNESYMQFPKHGCTLIYKYVHEIITWALKCWRNHSGNCIYARITWQHNECRINFHFTHVLESTLLCMYLSLQCTEYFINIYHKQWSKFVKV